MKPEYIIYRKHFGNNNIPRKEYCRTDNQSYAESICDALNHKWLGYYIFEWEMIV